MSVASSIAFSAAFRASTKNWRLGLAGREFGLSERDCTAPSFHFKLLASVDRQIDARARHAFSEATLQGTEEGWKAFAAAAQRVLPDTEKPTS